MTPKMTPCLNFHTKIMNSLHAVLYTLVDMTQLRKGKVSYFEWSARLTVFAMEWFYFNMTNCPVLYRHIERCITFLLEDFMKIIITSWKISSKLVFSLSSFYLLLINYFLNSCVFFRILNGMEKFFLLKLSVDFISAESYGLKPRKVFGFYNPKKK